MRRLWPLLQQAGVLPLLAERMQSLNNVSSKLRRAIGNEARYAAMSSLQQQMMVKTLSQSLRGAEIEPILVKGWSIARHYATPLLRSSCDVDLCVVPEKLKEAQRVIAELNYPYGEVDLHPGVSDLKDRGWRLLYNRSQSVMLDDCPVRVLREEDQLRLVCVHFWRHLGCKALWLCDIGALVDTCKPEFDWDYCFRGRKCDADVVQAVVALSVKLLGAELDEPWLARSVGCRLGWKKPFCASGNCWPHDRKLRTQNFWHSRGLYCTPFGTRCVCASDRIIPNGR